MLNHTLLLLAVFVTAGWCIVFWCIVLWQHVLSFLSVLRTAIAVGWRIIRGRPTFVVTLDAVSKSSTQFEGEVDSNMTNECQFEAVQQALNIYRTGQTLVNYVNESQQKND